MARHLHKGIHWVKLPHMKGKRKVRVDGHGKWHFMKGTRGGKRGHKKHGGHRVWVPGHYRRC